MRRELPTLAAAVIGVAGCSSFDFLGYRNDAPLHAIERPDGYPSIHFGAELAATRTSGESPVDLLAVSGGEGTPTIFYKLAEGDSLVDVVDPWDEYSDEEEAKTAGSGASLAGLPVFGAGLARGCVAIGEPTARNVHIDCEQDAITYDISMPDDDDHEQFGRFVRGIPPVAGGPWLLAVAARFWAVAVSNAEPGLKASLPVVPADGEVVEMAAGRLDAERFYIAITTFDEDLGRWRVHLYVQHAAFSRRLDHTACLERRDEPAFGGSMATGDLDGDGTDEIAISAGDDERREDAVYVYEIEDLVAAAPACQDEDVVPLAVVRPGDVEGMDVECEDVCGFGLALAIGDLATDDDTPELVVGAPGATVDGTGEGGAVYVYRGGALDRPAGVVADSSPESGQRFGGGVIVAPMAGRAELVAGAVGKGQAFIAFCTGVGEDIEAGGDVPFDDSGTVVSTRCRP